MARIKVKEIVRGLHRWKDAGKSIETEKVDFLANKHAHDFRISIECDVNHGDREIEFYLLRNDLKSILEERWISLSGFYQFDGMSCEDIGKFILTCLQEKHGSRNWKVEVAENEFQSAICFEEQKEEVVLDITPEKYDEISGKAREIFIGRKKSYGNSVDEIDLHTIVGLMRMKLFRIYSEGLKPKTEDELLDCINYAIFALTRISLD